MGCVGNVACVGEKINDYKILIGNPKGKKPLGRLSIIKTDLREVG
jgi:hypothetical protein